MQSIAIYSLSRDWTSMKLLLLDRLPDAAKQLMKAWQKVTPKASLRQQWARGNCLLSLRLLIFQVLILCPDATLKCSCCMYFIHSTEIDPWHI